MKHLVAIEYREAYDPPLGLVEEWWGECECGWRGRPYATESDAKQEGFDHAEQATANDMAATCDAAYDLGREEGW